MALVLKVLSSTLSLELIMSTQGCKPATLFAKMPQSLSKVYLHIVFSTKMRARSIHERVRANLQAYMVGIAASLGSYVDEIYANPDHVHILCTLPRTITIANFVSKIKRSSSRWIKTQGIENFKWQGGYAVFSVSHWDLKTVGNYIKNQPKHHRKATFKEALIDFFERYNMDYDEQYVWD